MTKIRSTKSCKKLCKTETRVKDGNNGKTNYQ